jgi:hypothetical protein
MDSLASIHETMGLNGAGVVAVYPGDRSLELASREGITQALSVLLLVKRQQRMVAAQQA